MRRRSSLPLMAGALLAASAAGCSLSVEGELPDVEVTRHGVAVPGVPFELRVSDPVISVPVTFDPRDQLALDPNSYRSVKLREVLFAVTGADTDLSFVRTVRMTINGARADAAGAAPLQVLRYERDDAGPPVGTVIDLPLAPPVDVLSAWRDPPCIIILEVQGALPEDPWTLDVTVRLAATIGL
jgi:hypothetical protein